ncbi:MAG: ABC transporter ATPase [Flavobacteriaceae bacterium]|nr:ABC transporter ATPase [Flavobacteriaceae bacterium]
MYLDFKQMPLEARVWIYQADRIFNTEELKKIKLLLQDFMTNWNNHGQGLKSSFTIKYNQFIILSVDENHKEASGCSIDSSVRIIKNIETIFKVDLMNKLLITFKDRDTIHMVSMAGFKKYIKENKINRNTIVFNNLVNTVADFKTNWEVKASDSWHIRLFN